MKYFIRLEDCTYPEVQVHNFDNLKDYEFFLNSFKQVLQIVHFGEINSANIEEIEDGLIKIGSTYIEFGLMEEESPIKLYALYLDNELIAKSSDINELKKFKEELISLLNNSLIIEELDN